MHSPSLQPIIETLDTDDANNSNLLSAMAPSVPPATEPREYSDLNLSTREQHSGLNISSGDAAATRYSSERHSPQRNSEVFRVDDGEDELLVMLEGCLQLPGSPRARGSPPISGTVHNSTKQRSSLSPALQQQHEMHRPVQQSAQVASSKGCSQQHLLSPGKRQRPVSDASPADTYNTAVSVFLDDPQSFSAFEEHGGVSVRALSEPPSVETSFEPSFDPSCEPSLELDGSREFLEDVGNTDVGVGRLLALGLDEAVKASSSNGEGTNDREHSVQHSLPAQTAETWSDSLLDDVSNGRTISGVLLSAETDTDKGRSLVQMAAQAAKEGMQQNCALQISE
jgi:hypothetical protein